MIKFWLILLSVVATSSQVFAAHPRVLGALFSTCHDVDEASNTRSIYFTLDMTAVFVTDPRGFLLVVDRVVMSKGKRTMSLTYGSPSAAAVELTFDLEGKGVLLEGEKQIPQSCVFNNSNSADSETKAH